MTVDLVPVVRPVVVALDAVDEREGVGLELGELLGERTGLDGVSVQRVRDRLQLGGEGVGFVHHRLGGGEQVVGLGRGVEGLQHLEAGVHVHAAVADPDGVAAQPGGVLVQLVEVAGELGYARRVDHLAPPSLPLPPWPGRSTFGAPSALCSAWAAISRSPAR